MVWFCSSFATYKPGGHGQVASGFISPGSIHFSVKKEKRLALKCSHVVKPTQQEAEGEINITMKYCNQRYTTGFFQV